jgi:polyisoprenoid-binding protein YceI
MIIMIALFCTGFSNKETWVIDSESKLSIHGATNVNTFTCNLISYSGHDTLRYFNDYTTSTLKFTTNRMTVPITSFNCGTQQISRDFQKALNSDKYPQIDINFISLDNGLTNNTEVKGVVDITLAGVTTRYSIQFGLNCTNGTILLSGTQPVNFSDFNLKAPQKFRGLIRVEEILKVEFHLVLKPV